MLVALILALTILAVVAAFVIKTIVTGGAIIVVDAQDCRKLRQLLAKAKNGGDEPPLKPITQGDLMRVEERLVHFPQTSATGGVSPPRP